RTGFASSRDARLRASNRRRRRPRGSPKRRTPDVMTQARIATLALTAALLSANGVAAQVASKVEAGTLVMHRDGELPANIFRIAPGVSYANPLFALSAQGSAWLNGQQWQVADGIVSGTFTSPTVYGVRAELLTNASRAFADQALGTDQVDVQTR